MKFFIILMLILGAISSANSAIVLIQQPGTFYWYKAGTVNKYPPTNPINFAIPSSWVKQTDKVYNQCKSDGGSFRYYEQGIDCYGQKPRSPPLTSCEAFMCKDDFGITFDLAKNSVLACPRVVVTKEQIAMLYDGVQHEVPSCR